MGVIRIDAQQPEPFRWRSDAVARLVVDADRDERGERGSVLVEYADRPVSGIHERNGSLDDPLQHVLEVEIGSDRQHRVQEASQASWSQLVHVHGATIALRFSRRTRWLSEVTTSGTVRAVGENVSSAWDLWLSCLARGSLMMAA